MVTRRRLSASQFNQRHRHHRRRSRAPVVCGNRPRGRLGAGRASRRRGAGQGDMGAWRHALRAHWRAGGHGPASGGQPGVRPGWIALRHLQRSARPGIGGVGLPRRRVGRARAVRSRDGESDVDGVRAGSPPLYLQPVRWTCLPGLRRRPVRGVRVGPRPRLRPGVWWRRHGLRRRSIGHHFPNRRERPRREVRDGAGERGGVPHGDGTRWIVVRLGADALDLRFGLPHRRRRAHRDARRVVRPAAGPGVRPLRGSPRGRGACRFERRLRATARRPPRADRGRQQSCRRRLRSSRAHRRCRQRFGVSFAPSVS